MSERTTCDLVSFDRPFFVDALERVLTAGTYKVETIEESIDGLSFLAYRIVSTSIVIPLSGGGPNSYQLVPIDSDVVRAARMHTNKVKDS